MLKALQLTAEQDAKSFFVSSGKSSLFSVSDYNTAQQASGQTTGTKIDNDYSESDSLHQLGSQVQGVGNVSNLRPISSPSSSLVANKSQVPVTFSQQMPQTHYLQGVVSVTNATLPQLPLPTCYTSTPPNNESENAYSRISASSNVAGTYNRSLSQFSTVTEEKLKFDTSNQYLFTGKTNSSTCSMPVSNKAALTTTAQFVESSVSSQTINHPSNNVQSGSYNFAVVTADTDFRERSKNQQCNNAATADTDSREQSKNQQCSNAANFCQFVTSETESNRARDLKSPVELPADSPASSYCSEISVPTPDSNEGKPSRMSGKRSRSITPENKVIYKLSKKSKKNV